MLFDISDKILAARLRNALALIARYDFGKPAELFLGEQFRTNKNWGSRDRRFLRSAFYCWLRAGKLLKTTADEDKLLLSIWLCIQEKETQIPESLYSSFSGDNPSQRYHSLQHAGLAIENVADLLPGFTEMMPEAMTDEFAFDHLLPRRIWLRPTTSANRFSLLCEQLPGVIFNGEAAGLPAGTRIPEELAEISEIQDLSSQIACREIAQNCEGLKVWDTCSGSGGKSLFLADHCTHAELYCSDIRVNILENLQHRFEKRNNKPKGISVTDLNQSREEIRFSSNHGQQTAGRGFFDVLLTDVPCTGSGTWARNPENLHREANIASYASLQLRIVSNALPFLRSGGMLYYMTCSVFHAENTDNIAALVSGGRLELLSQKLIRCAPEGGDSLFIAVLRKR